MVMRHGGTVSRPGTSFVCEVKDSTKTVRLIPFIFNSSNTYVLEFGNLYVRFIKNGAQITETAQNITGITNASTGVLTYSGADNYANGDEVVISGIVGPIGRYLNGRNFKVAGLNAGANTFQLNYLDGTAVNTTSMGSYTSGGTIAEVYTVTSSYVEADLPALKFVQSADVITIVHPSYAPTELARTSDTSWAFSAVSSLPRATGANNLGATAGGGGANTYRYTVTRIDPDTGEESLPAAVSLLGASISGVTAAYPVSVAATAHGFVTGDWVFVSFAGMVEIHERIFKITRTDANNFTLNGEDGSLYADNGGTGGANLRSKTLTSAAAPTAAAPHVLTWDDENGPANSNTFYNIYKEIDGVFGYIGIARGGTFSDVGYSPNVDSQPPFPNNPFVGAGNYPAAVTYFQQRILYTGSNNEPETTRGSRTGLFTNFTTSAVLQDDDALTFTLIGRQVNRMKDLLDIGKLVALTEAGVWSIEGDGAGIITPTAINPKQRSYIGSSSLSPLVVGGNALYVQARGSAVRDLSYELQSDGYRGNDLTIFSSHLVEGYTISDWAYQEIPNSIVWIVRSDGTLLGLTYVLDQQVIGWHRHDTDGAFENVCSIPEGTEDAVYVVVERTIGSSTKRYIERLNTRFVTSETIADFVGMDCALSYDGRNTGSRTMTLSGSGWTYQDTLTLTASTAFFTSDDVGNQIHLNVVDDDGLVTDTVRCSITAYTSTTVVSVLPHKTVPASLRAAATLEWGRAVDELTGLWHLEGKTVSVFGDGFVVASPYNSTYSTLTVSGGAITLDRPRVVVHVGLPYLCDLETLDIDVAEGESLASRKKSVGKVTLHTEKTRGVFIGRKAPSDDETDALENLYEAKVRNEEGYDDPVALATGTIDVIIQPGWDSNGRVFIRQVDPVPISVLAATPEAMVPVRGGG